MVSKIRVDIYFRESSTSHLGYIQYQQKATYFSPGL